MSEDPTLYQTQREDIVHIRINSVGFKSISEERGEFLKYSPNQYYQKLGSYIDNGWEDKGDFIKCKERHGTIDKSLFNLPETCYVIGYLNYKKRENCFELNTVGDRLLHVMVDGNQRNDFYKTYQLADKCMMELIVKKEEEESYV